MKGKKLPEGTEVKLIGGVEHRRVPCILCKELIWVSVHNPICLCTDCYDPGHRERRGNNDPAYQSDARYHGSSGNL